MASSSILESKSKTDSKNDSKMIANNAVDSRPKSNGEQPKVWPTSSSMPSNRLEELDLNDIVVELKDVNFSYSKSSGVVLNHFSMTFPRSSIYGFLGPSGCGKTTIIKIITGLLKPSSGVVLVNGKTPKHKDNQIPGPGVGYMSQENCLLEEFSIEETFVYFSRIYGLTKEYMKTRIEFIMNFLDLPDKNRKVINLSGGQQRRTSLGVAIIHNPPILILDEPTVGVDPVLREKIWKYLMQLSTEEKTSIMITTHYIDECRRAHVIGLMRNGRLLAESSPNILLTHFKTHSLEEVFLKLCRAEEEKLVGVEIPPNLNQMRDKIGRTPVKSFRASPDIQCKPNTWKRFGALFNKYSIVVCGNKTTLFMELFVPMIVLTLFAICIGTKPRDLDVALFSEERRNTSVDKSQKLSEVFMKNIDNKTIILKDFDSKDSAIESVKSGQTYGAIYIDRNFSFALKVRMTSFIMKTEVSEKVLNQSTIYFFGDLSDFNIFLVLYQTLLESMTKSMTQIIPQLIKELTPQLMLNQTDSQSSNQTDSQSSNQTDSQSSNQTDSELPNPIKTLIEITDPPIYGDSDPLFNEFLLPGIVVTGVFMLAIALTTLNVVEEKRKGLLERTVVAGAKMYEIMLSMLSVHLFLLILQSIITIITVYIVFKFKNEGNYLIIGSILVLQNITGMSLGLFISSIADDTKMAIIICIACIIPFLVISGIVWPLEGMEWPFLQNISYLLPQTMAIKALRSVTHKGWGLNSLYVWWGYIIPIVWCVIFITGSTLINHFKN